MNILFNLYSLWLHKLHNSITFAKKKYFFLLNEFLVRKMHNKLIAVIFLIFLHGIGWV